ncbi:hypothetical protein Lal_00040570 [Lupinus albus]|nr:hypothetical protein Lal_00040570 [Lupinus albus]
MWLLHLCLFMWIWRFSDSHQTEKGKSSDYSVLQPRSPSLSLTRLLHWKAMADNDEELEMPRDAKIVKSLLKSMGVEDYEPRVIHKFLELWYRYVVDVLTDAQVYSEHASKSAIDCDDVKLAIQSKVNFSFSQPPPREVLLELAQNRNKIPLPKSIAGPGVLLPPDQDTLISPNYQLAIPNKRPAEPIEETEDEEAANPNPAQEDQMDMQMQQNPHQRVSFPLPKRQKD